MKYDLKNQHADTIRQPGVPPPGYREVLYWKISGSPLRLLLMNLAGAALLVAWGGLFFWLATSTGWLPERVESSGWGPFLITAAVLILVLVLHELVHGAFISLFGAVPRFGAMWSKLMFYATAPGFAFPRRQFLIVALAPLVVISLLAVLAMALLAGTPWVLLLVFAATFNAAGAVGDLWIMAVILRYPPHTYVIDERDGVRILLPQDYPPVSAYGNG